VAKNRRTSVYVENVGHRLTPTDELFLGALVVCAAFWLIVTAVIQFLTSVDYRERAGVDEMKKHRRSF
jgi:hypothetical protein